MSTSVAPAQDSAVQITKSNIKTRTRCEVWTRVMGYHRPVQNFNIGKKSEHYSRVHFNEEKSLNQCFCTEFAC